MRKIRFWLLAATAMVGVLTAAACGGSSSASTAAPGTTYTMLSDPASCAAPSGPYSHVYVTVSDVEASTSGTATSGFVDLTPNLKSSPMQIDLLGQAGNACFLATLGSTTELQPGNYQQIRLILANTVTATNNPCGGTTGNCVVLDDGSVHALDLSSEAQTGIKIPSGQIAGGQFVVAAGQTKDLDVNFDTCDSIVAEGNGQYRLKPVLHAGEVATTSSSINGTVVDKATGKAVAGTTMVALEEKDSSGIDRIVMTTLADNNGNFVFCPVPVGTYDIVATAVSSSNVDYAATVTTGVANGSALGTIPLLAAGAPGSITGQVNTSTGTAPTAADITLSALQTATVSANAVTFTVPLPVQAGTVNAAGTASVTTAAAGAGGACAANSDCASYTLQLPAAGANAGSFSAGGSSYAQASPSSGGYSIEGDAYATNSTSTPDCSPATQTASDTGASVGLSLTAAQLSLTAASLNFTGCQ